MKTFNLQKRKKSRLLLSNAPPSTDVLILLDENGKEQLVWSCRLEEPMEYGEFLHTVPKKDKISPDEVHSN